MADPDSALSRLSAGLARDEAIALATGPVPAEWHVGDTWCLEGVRHVVIEPDEVAFTDKGKAPHIAHHNPARVLRQVEAIRKVLAVCDAIDAEALAGAWWEGKYGDWADDIREALASIYTEDTDKEGAKS